MNYFFWKLFFLPQREQNEILPLRFTQGQNDRRVKNNNFFSVFSVAKSVFLLFFILFISCEIISAAEIDYYTEGMKQLQMENYEEAEPLLLKAHKKEPEIGRAHV